MNEALEFVLEAYRTLLFTPHKNPKERQLMGVLYTQLYLNGGQPFRTRAEKLKVEQKAFFEGGETVEKKSPKAEPLVSALNKFQEAMQGNPEPLPENQNEVAAEDKPGPLMSYLNEAKAVQELNTAFNKSETTQKNKRGPKPRSKE